LKYSVSYSQHSYFQDSDNSDNKSQSSLSSLVISPNNYINENSLISYNDTNEVIAADQNELTNFNNNKSNNNTITVAERTNINVSIYITYLIMIINI
jgi:hypothetical protein